MKRKILNIAFIVILLLILIIMHSNIVEADDMLSDVNEWEPSTITTTEASSVLEKAGVVLGLIRNISVIVAVISLMVIGIKYIFGSVEEKADYKKSLLPYVIGVVMAAAGTTLVSFIYNSLT